MCFCRIIVRMANYNKTTQEIARPSDLLAGLRVYTTTLHSLSSYVNVDVSRLVKTVLLQQTQPVDSRGATTITTLYTNWCVEVQAVIYIESYREKTCIDTSPRTFSHSFFVFFLFLHVRYLESLLRQASSSLIVHCPSMHCFINQLSENEPVFKAEEFSDISGMF